MRRIDLEHVIRAAGAIANTQEIVIIGSQAILGSFPDAPAELTFSQEADLFPVAEPEKADLVDGSIGEKSSFHETFGYYAHGVSPETAILPKNWKTRLVKIQNENTNGITGFCLNPADLAISKLAAGRQKDLEFVRALFKHRLLKHAEVESLLGELGEKKDVVRERLARVVGMSK